MVLQPTFEHETKVLEGFQVAGGATICWVEGKAGRVGDDAGEDEAKCEEGGESAASASTHAVGIVDMLFVAASIGPASCCSYRS